MKMTENERVIRRLYQITSNHESGFTEQVRELLSMGCERFGLEIGILSNITGNRYRVVHQVSPDDVALADEAEFNLPETYCAETLAANKPVGFEHVAESDMSTHPAYAAFALEAYIGVPIAVEGEVFGTLNFSSPYPRERKFSAIDIDALKLMGIWIEGELSRLQYQQQILQQAEELAERNKQLAKLAKTDGLTQVGNRHSFYQELSKHIKFAQRLSIPLSVVMFDIDNFKQYNDTHGHLAGDKALIAVSGTINRLARSTDYVARYGGEEFIVLLPDTHQKNAVLAAERFRAAINEIECLERPVSSSFGVSSFFPSRKRVIDFDAISEKLIGEADVALYFSKTQGKDCVHHYRDVVAATDTSSDTVNAAQR